MALIPINKLIRGEKRIASPADDGDVSAAPLGGTRSEAIQRLQIGVGGLLSMVLLVGVANIVIDQARETQATTVPQAAATVEAEAPQNDPLADAGIVPDLPAEAEEAPLPEGPIVPEQGEGTELVE